MHPEFIVAYDVAGKAFLWCVKRANNRYVCTRRMLTGKEVRRIEAGTVEINLLTDRNQEHGNFSDVASAFAFFADVPDQALAGYARTLLGRVGSVRGVQ